MCQCTRHEAACLIVHTVSRASLVRTQRPGSCKLAVVEAHFVPHEPTSITTRSIVTIPVRAIQPLNQQCKSFRREEVYIPDSQHEILSVVGFMEGWLGKLIEDQLKVVHSFDSKEMGRIDIDTNDTFTSSPYWSRGMLHVVSVSINNQNVKK